MTLRSPGSSPCGHHRPTAAPLLSVATAAESVSGSPVSAAMLACRLRTCLFAALLVALLAEHAAAAPRSRRQLADDNTLQPIDEENEELEREKRKLEGVTQAKYTVKNALLGFVFGKLNSFIDAKTRLVESLDKKNIELNKQYGIEPPQNGLASLTGVVSQVVGPKLQYLAPKLQAASGLLGGLSSGSSGSGSSGGGSGLGSILSLVTSLSGSSSGGAAAGTVETVDSDEDDS
ncbi:unnamed protein product [Pieris macdunnoughi]|uniref:Uncharacterized protein n=1 Tax=Pieris macdunnoughi TaxID=345717 RepID=A0A821RDN5_9NEOP|nr:unnamed protein product [Pieris macdunnoughi]